MPLYWLWIRELSVTQMMGLANTFVDALETALHGTVEIETPQDH